MANPSDTSQTRNSKSLRGAAGDRPIEHAELAYAQMGSGQLKRPSFCGRRDATRAL